MTVESRPVIWARLSGQGRGPARTLDHSTITDAAIAIADRDGLDAVSMRKIAGRMDRSTMSLYRHIDSKDDLYELMYDAVLGELELPAAPSEGWRVELAGLVRNLRRMYHRHPWATRLGRRPTLGPNSLRVLEYSLACVDGLGLEIDGMLDAISVARQFTLGFVQAEIGQLEAQRESGMDEAAYRRRTGPYLVELLGAGAHPYLRRLVEDAEDFPDQDTVFERRLATVLDGIAITVDRAAASGRG